VRYRLHAGFLREFLGVLGQRGVEEPNAHRIVEPVLWVAIRDEADAGLNHFSVLDLSARSERETGRK